jgi:hypothetical protein
LDPVEYATGFLCLGTIDHLITINTPGGEEHEIQF